MASELRDLANELSRSFWRRYSLKDRNRKKSDITILTVASYQGLFAPEFVACSTNVREGLVNLSHAVMYLNVG